MSEKLAIDGGTPVRTKPFPVTNVGEAVIGEEEKAEVLDVLNACSPFRFYGPDPQKKADQLEAEFKVMTGKKHALAVTSGTAALKVSLLAAGVGPGDEVIVPSVTFIATAGVVVACHARPVFAEVGEDFGLDPADVERRITKRTKAIIPVHLLGGAVDMDPIVAIGKKHGIVVLEDCAQSTGAEYKGKTVGAFGDINAFSMQFQKVITAGEGGMVVTDDDELYDRAVRAHDHGNNRWEAGEPEDAFCAEVYRLNEMSAAFGLAQFRKLSGNLETMRKYNRIVRAEIEKLDGMTIRSLVDPDGATGQTITVLFETKEVADRFREAYGKEGVPASSLYGGKLVLENPQIMNQRMVSKNGPFNSPLYDGPITYRVEDYPQSVELLSRAAWLWFSPVMGDEECDDIIKALHKVHAAVIG